MEPTLPKEFIVSKYQPAILLKLLKGPNLRFAKEEPKLNSPWTKSTVSPPTPSTRFGWEKMIRDQESDGFRHF